MKIYVSHPIRGIHRDAGQAEIEANNLRAKIFGAALRLRYPQHEFHIPAEHEEFVALAHVGHYLSADEILSIDCQLIDRSDGVIFYDHQARFSPGMLVENHHACQGNKPTAILSSTELIYTLPELEVLLK